MVNSFLDLGHSWKIPLFFDRKYIKYHLWSSHSNHLFVYSRFLTSPSKNTAIAVALVAIITFQPRQKKYQKNMLFTCLVCQLPTYPLQRCFFSQLQLRSPTVRGPTRRPLLQRLWQRCHHPKVYPNCKPWAILECPPGEIWGVGVVELVVFFVLGGVGLVGVERIGWL